MPSTGLFVLQNDKRIIFVISTSNIDLTLHSTWKLSSRRIKYVNAADLIYQYSSKTVEKSISKDFDVSSARFHSHCLYAVQYGNSENETYSISIGISIRHQLPKGKLYFD